MHRPIVTAFATLGLLTGTPGLSAAQLGTLLKKKAEEMASRAEVEAARDAGVGIYFDAGSDRIRPEAAPVLQEIAALQVAHPGLALVLEGHTDSVGSAEANLALSRRRAAAVRQALVTSFGVDPSGLTVRGLGATRPAASNDTPQGRQFNRRVELARSEE